MKKIILFILFSISLQAQDFILLMSGSGFYSYVAVNVGSTVSEDQIIFSGASVKTKTTKALGTTRAVTRYMHWWEDVLTGGTFETDLDNWVSATDTMKWVASGGGFTGAMYVVTSSASTEGVYYSPYNTAGSCRIQADINIITADATVRVQYYDNVGIFESILLTGTGLKEVDTTVSFGADNELYISTNNDTASFYVDNVSLTMSADSVSGYSKVLTSVTEDIPYYYSQSVSYITKTGSTVWDADDVDTCYSVPNSVNFQSVYQGNLHWIDESSSETGFQIVVDTLGGTSWDKYDSTTIADVDGLTVTGLYAGGDYQVKIRTIGDYANSAYSLVWYFTTAEDLSDMTAPSAPTNIDAINLTKVTPTVPADTIPIFTPTSFTSAANITLDSLVTSNGMALTVFDSCTAYAAGDSFRVGIYGDTVTARTWVFPNDTLYCIKSSSGSYSTTVTCSLTVGGVLKTWSISTGSAPPSGDYSVWYVDRDSPLERTFPETYDGRSWETAWIHLDSSSHSGPWGVNWSLIGDGDTIYVSGGTDSTRYVPESISSQHYIWPPVERSFNEQVVICPSWEEGHNGDVYFVTKPTAEGLLTITNISNIKFTGFKLIDERTELAGGGLITITDSLNVFDNCYVLNSGLTTGIYLWGYKLTMSNCYFDVIENDLEAGADPVGMSEGRGGHIVEGNTIIMRNGSMTTTSHRDGIQISTIGEGTERLPIIIRNNLLIDTRPEGISWTSMIYNHQYQIYPALELIIYNNIIVSQKKYTPIAAVTLQKGGNGSDPSPLTIRVFNNTIIHKSSGGNSSMLFVSNYSDTLIAKNNLWVGDTTFVSMIGFGTYGEVLKDFDYNIYAEYGNVNEYIAVYGSYRTWDDWQGLGFDLNSDTTDSRTVTFTNKYGLEFTDYYTETGRDLGVNLAEEHPEFVAMYPDVMYDAVGNPRPAEGAWDIGALQYQGGGMSQPVWKRLLDLMEGWK